MMDSGDAPDVSNTLDAGVPDSTSALDASDAPLDVGETADAGNTPEAGVSVDADAGLACPDACTTQEVCTAPVACGAGSVVSQQCSTMLGGACQSTIYKTSDGHSFACASCGDCSAALQQVTAYCQTLMPSTTCGTPVACQGTSVTYHLCSTSVGGVCKAAAYDTSNGQGYACTSCTDCAAALSSVQSYCKSIATAVVTCTSSAACGSHGATDQKCTTSVNNVCQSVAYSASDGSSFACASCTDCTAAEASMRSYCASQCLNNLSGIGTGDFTVAFSFTTSENGIAALVNQRQTCTHGVFWDVRLDSGRLFVETDDGTNYTAFDTVNPNSIADGQPHDVIVRRVGGVLTAYIDGAVSGSAQSMSSFGTLNPLASATDACTGIGTTVSFVGTVADVCVTAP
jgi:hypothetical protein